MHAARQTQVFVQNRPSEKQQPAKPISEKETIKAYCCVVYYTCAGVFSSLRLLSRRLLQRLRRGAAGEAAGGGAEAAVAERETAEGDRRDPQNGVGGWQFGEGGLRGLCAQEGKVLLSDVYNRYETYDLREPQGGAASLPQRRLQGRLLLHLLRSRRLLQGRPRVLPRRLPRLPPPQEQQDRRQGPRPQHRKTHQLPHHRPEGTRVAHRLPRLLPPALLGQASPGPARHARAQGQGRHKRLPQLRPQELAGSVHRRTREGPQQPAARADCLLDGAAGGAQPQRGGEGETGVEYKAVVHPVEDEALEPEPGEVGAAERADRAELQAQREGGGEGEEGRAAGVGASGGEPAAEAPAQAALLQQDHQRRADHQHVLLPQVPRGPPPLPRLRKRLPGQQVPRKVQRRAQHAHSPPHRVGQDRRRLHASALAVRRRRVVRGPKRVHLPVQPVFRRALPAAEQGQGDLVQPRLRAFLRLPGPGDRGPGAGEQQQLRQLPAVLQQRQLQPQPRQHPDVLRYQERPLQNQGVGSLRTHLLISTAIVSLHLLLLHACRIKKHIIRCCLSLAAEDGEYFAEGLPGVLGGLDHFLPAHVVDDDLVDGEHVGCEVRHPRDDLGPLLQLAHEEVLRLLLLRLAPPRLPLAHALALLLFLLVPHRHLPALPRGDRRGQRLGLGQLQDFLLVLAALAQPLPDERPDDLEDLFEEGGGAVEVVELVVEALPEVLVGVRVGHLLLALHQRRLLRQHQRTQRLQLLEGRPQRGLIFEDGPDNWAHVFDVEHVVLVGEAEAGEDEFDLGPPFAVEAAVDDLEVGVAEYVAVLLLLAVDGPQQLLDHRAPEGGHVLEDEAGDEVEADLAQDVDLLERLLLEVLVAALELADLVDAVVVDALREVGGHLEVLAGQELLDEVVYLAEGQFEDVLAGQGRHDVEAGGVVAELAAVHEGELDEVVPGEAGAEEDALEVLLQVPALEAAPAAQPLEQPEPLVRAPQLLQAVLEVLHEDLRHLLAPRPHHEPLQHELLQPHQPQPLPHHLVVEQHLVHRQHVQQAARHLLAEREGSYHVLQELQRRPARRTPVRLRPLALRDQEHLRARVHLDRHVLLPVADLLLQLGGLVRQRFVLRPQPIGSLLEQLRLLLALAVLVLVEGDDVDLEVALELELGLLLHVVQLVVVDEQGLEVALAGEHLLVLALLGLERGQLPLQPQDLLLVDGEVALDLLHELQARLQLLADLRPQRVALDHELLQVEPDALPHLGVGVGELGVVDLQQLPLQLLQRPLLDQQPLLGDLLYDLGDDVLEVLEGPRRLPEEYARHRPAVVRHQHLVLLLQELFDEVVEPAAALDHAAHEVLQLLVGQVLPLEAVPVLVEELHQRLGEGAGEVPLQQLLHGLLPREPPLSRQRGLLGAAADERVADGEVGERGGGQGAVGEVSGGGVDGVEHD